ncbi:MAG: hypothetical protein ACRDDY_05405 [Clostridium sp.]|uniref:hypothetical protein n=1 Tax=Clostridium sp. TaxID=1506 RepID=UPI003EE60BA1
MTVGDLNIFTLAIALSLAAVILIVAFVYSKNKYSDGDMPRLDESDEPRKQLWHRYAWLINMGKDLDEKRKCMVQLKTEPMLHQFNAVIQYEISTPDVYDAYIDYAERLKLALDDKRRVLYNMIKMACIVQITLDTEGDFVRIDNVTVNGNYVELSININHIEPARVVDLISNVFKGY